MEEQWKEIARFPSYEVSNLGRIRRIVSPYIDSNGYPAFQVWHDGTKQASVRVHQLVAEAFLPNPANLPEVNHKDSTKVHNFVENLEWVSRMENMRHMIRSGSRKTAKGETSGVSKITEAQVIEIRSLAGTLTQREIGQRFGISQFNVSAIVRRQTWNHVPPEPTDKALRKARRPTTFHRGSEHPRAKLNDALVREIRLLRDTLPPREIAARIGVSQETVQSVLKGRTWVHVI